MPVSRDLTTLTALAQALSRTGNLADALGAALTTVAELLGLETGWVWLLDEDTQEPHLAAARALPPALADRPEAMRGDCYCLSTFGAGDLRGAANVNVVRCSRLAQIVGSTESGAGTAGLRCHASIPLVVGERRLGMLNVASRDWRVLSDDELNFLSTAGALVSLAVERSRLEAAGVRAAAAEERNQLAREIHDTLAQRLAALTMKLEVADSLAAAAGDASLAQAITRALDLARATLEEARRSVLDLRAAPLDGKTLREALWELAAETRDVPGTAIEVTVDDDGFERYGDDLPAAVEVGVYRIVQQALANVARHARATRIDISLTREAEHVRLLIDDDGDGFDPAAVPPGRFGLVGMSERARLLGGTLMIDSRPGEGTALDISLPLRPAIPAPNEGHT